MLNRSLLVKLLRFGLVGGTVTLVFMGLSQVFSDWWGKQVGFLAAYPIAVALHFFLNKWWTFANHRADKGRQLGEYLMMVAVTFALQWAVYTAVTHWTHLPAGIAAAIANLAQMAITFFAMERRIFAAGRSDRVTNDQ